MKTPLLIVAVVLGMAAIVWAYPGKVDIRNPQESQLTTIWGGDFPLARGAFLRDTEIGLRSDGVVVWRDKPPKKSK
jgi:hypothetical protein